MESLVHGAVDIDKWINQEIIVDDSVSIRECEELCNQTVVQLQLISRDMSQMAERNIETIMENLPKTMAELSALQPEIDSITEAIKSLSERSTELQNQSSNLEQL